MALKSKFGKAIHVKLLAVFLMVTLIGNYAWPQKKPASTRIILTNNQNFKRVNEVVTISRNQFKEIPKGYFPEVKKGGRVYIIQLTDDDLDGKWDNLLIEVSLKPNSKDTLSLNWLKPGRQIMFPKFTNVRFSLKTKTTAPEKEINAIKRTRGFTQNVADPVYQMEGPAIENDKVAFRTFFDIRNSEDIYGKITNKPILEKVGVGASWHILQDWGMDIFKTGNSLGAGGLAVEENNNFYRLADADTTTFQALYEGPLKAAFRLTFKNWDIGSGHGDGSEVISMVKGNYYYQNDIRVTLRPDQYLVSGIANFIPDSLVYEKQNSKFSSVAVYGPQAEGTLTNLGVAIVFGTDQYAYSKTTSNSDVIPNNSYVVLKNLPAGKKTVYFVACWEKTDAHFSTQKGFEDYLAITAKKLANPIRVKVTYSK